MSNKEEYTVITWKRAADASDPENDVYISIGKIDGIFFTPIYVIAYSKKMLARDRITYWSSMYTDTMKKLYYIENVEECSYEEIIERYGSYLFSE